MFRFVTLFKMYYRKITAIKNRSLHTTDFSNFIEKSGVCLLNKSGTLKFYAVINYPARIV